MRAASSDRHGEALAGKLPGIGIEVKETIPHDNPTRSMDNIALAFARFSRTF